MMQALELLGLAKGTSPDEAMPNSEEIKPVAVAIIKLRLSKGISRSVSQSVSSILLTHMGVNKMLQLQLSMATQPFVTSTKLTF